VIGVHAALWWTKAVTTFFCAAAMALYGMYYLVQYFGLPYYAAAPLTILLVAALGSGASPDHQSLCGVEQRGLRDSAGYRHFLWW
jgi:hypothetical protein